MGETAPTPHSLLPKLAQAEPWRWGRTDIKKEEVMCTGDLDWEPGTGWWSCRKCGHVGSAPHFGHFSALSPTQPASEHGSWVIPVATAIVAVSALILRAMKT